MPEQKIQTFGERLFQLCFWDMRLSQTEFANKFALPLGSLKDWEQDRVTPTASTVILFEVIKRNPKLVATASNVVRKEILKNKRKSHFPTNKQ